MRPRKGRRIVYERRSSKKQSGGTPLQKGAELAVFLARREATASRASSISAAWDLGSLPEHSR